MSAAIIAIIAIAGVAYYASQQKPGKIDRQLLAFHGGHKGLTDAQRGRYFKCFSECPDNDKTVKKAKSCAKKCRKKAKR